MSQSVAQVPSETRHPQPQKSKKPVASKSFTLTLDIEVTATAPFEATIGSPQVRVRVDPPPTPANQTSTSTSQLISSGAPAQSAQTARPTPTGPPAEPQATAATPASRALHVETSSHHSRALPDESSSAASRIFVPETFTGLSPPPPQILGTFGSEATSSTTSETQHIVKQKGSGVKKDAPPDTSLSEANAPVACAQVERSSTRTTATNP